MPHRFVLERAVGTHSNSVQRALCPLTSTYSVVYLFSQSYFNTKFIIAPRHSGFIPFCALSAAKGMVIAMNKKMIAYILGKIMLFDSLLMIPSVIVGFIYGEKPIEWFLIPIFVLAALGILLGRKKPVNTAIYARDGFFIVAAAWIITALAGAVPFYLCGYFDSVWDCIFEITSGFTTTGASVLPDPGSLPKCILFWRSFSHWIGGMGVLVFVLAIIPLSEERSLHLMRAEVPGPVVGKLLPRMNDTAKVLYLVYTALTAVLIVLLLLGGMPLFDSVCHAFGTAGTGGFSVKTEGIAFYNSAYIDVVLSVFMLLFGINFNLFYLILIGKAREAVKNEELRWYLIIVGASTLAISANIYLTGNASGIWLSLRQAFFQVSSIITTTGFATADFALWPQFSQTLLVLLMIIGACAGSTGGGLKVSRIAILIKTFSQEIKHLLHPRSVTVVRFEKKPIDDVIIRGTLIYFGMYAFIVCVSTLLLSLDGFDFTTNLTAELACFNNIGPGIGAVGPMSNFGAYSAFSKLLLSFNMLLGRLEIMPMLVLFSPGILRRNVH